MDGNHFLVIMQLIIEHTREWLAPLADYIIRTSVSNTHVRVSVLRIKFKS